MRKGHEGKLVFNFFFFQEKIDKKAVMRNEGLE